MLNFNYSWIYDLNIHEWNNKKFDKDSYKKTLDYIKKLKNKWKTIDKGIFDEINKVSGLKWKNKNIECYVVSLRIYPFSIPLTISVHKDIDEQIEVLIHELIHNIWTQNMDKIKIKEYKNYGKLNQNTKIHILVHAIEKKILFKFFKKKRIEKRIRRHDKFPDYKKAWEIVEKEGSNKIIKDCIKNG